MSLFKHMLFFYFIYNVLKKKDKKKQCTCKLNDVANNIYCELSIKCNLNDCSCVLDNDNWDANTKCVNCKRKDRLQKLKDKIYRRINFEKSKHKKINKEKSIKQFVQNINATIYKKYSNVEFLKSNRSR